MGKPRVVPGLLIIVGILGCASTGSMRARPLDEGVAREFTGDYATVLRAAREAVIGAGLAIDLFDEVNETTAVIVAKKGSSLFSFGELVRVVVEQSANDRVVVRVVSDRKLATNIAARGDYADTIFSNVTLALR